MKRSMRNTLRRQIDAQTGGARDSAIVVPARGWINAIRRSLGMTERELGIRLGVSQASVHGLERSEADETIRINTLRRAAAALDCELVYILVPRRPLEDVVQERARLLARRELERVGQTMALEAQETSLERTVDERAKEIASESGLWRDP